MLVVRLLKAIFRQTRYKVEESTKFGKKFYLGVVNKFRKGAMQFVDPGVHDRHFSFYFTPSA